MSLIEGIRPDGTSDAAKLTSGSILQVAIASGDVGVTGGATEAKQDDILTALGDLATEVTLSDLVDALTALNTTFDFQTGTATDTSTAFASGTYPKGFKIRNLSSNTAIYIDTTTATTSSWRIGPGESEFFDLEDPSIFECIVAAGTADYQIGGTS